MIKNKQVDLYVNAAGTTDITTGIYSEGALKYSKTLMVDVQPYSTDKLKSDYGFEIDVNKRIFYDRLDDDIQIDTVFKYPNNDKYFLEVKKILDWDNYMEIFCLDNTK